MKLIRLNVEHYKRIDVAELQLDPDAAGVVALMGPNEAGKSSMLDAFQAVIAGRNAPKRAMPIKLGEESAEIIAEFRDDDGSHIVVTRRYTPKGTTIEVREDGLRKAKPDAILSRLYSHVALDPLAFANLKPKEQVDTLVRLSGFDPSEIDEKHADVYATRTEVNALARSYDAQLNAMRFDADVADLPIVSVAELSEQLDGIRTRNAKRAHLAGEKLIAERRYDAIEQQIAELRAEQSEISLRRAELTNMIAEIGEPEDDAELLSIMATAETRNSEIRYQQQRAALAKTAEETHAKSDALTQQLADLAEQKRAGFANADMPVPGLTIEGEQVLLDGTPFSETSAGRKLRTSTAIAMRLNPELRAIVIQDGSLLDAENRRIVDELAREHDFTVLMEIVDENAPSGIIFEDGRVAAVKVVES